MENINEDSGINGREFTTKEWGALISNTPIVHQNNQEISS